MDNEVKITVTSEDATDGGFRSAEAKGKSFGSRLKDLLTKSGGEAGEGFGLNFVGRAGPLVAKAPVGPHLIAAIGAAAPAITATLSTAITAGAGIGAVGLGAALSANDPRVAAGIDSLGAHLMSELRLSAEPFVPAMIKATDKAKAAVRTIRPELDAIFAKSSTYLDPLVDGAIGFVQNALPGFRSLVDAAEPLVEILGEELPELGEDLTAMFEDIAESAGRNEDEFRAILDTVGLIVRQVGSVITLMDYLAAGPTRSFLDLIGQSNKELEDEGPAEAIEKRTEEMEDQSKALREARDTANDFADAMDRITNANLDAREASLQYREQLDETIDAIDRKKKVSEEEEGSLYDLARAGNDVIESMEEQGASAGELSGRQETLRADFIRTAEKMGYSREQAVRLADDLLRIPRGVKTNVQVETDEARRRVREYKAQLASISRTITTRFNVDTNGNATVFRGQAHGGISGAQSGGIRSDLTMVGEYGRELVDLPPGAHVRSNPDTERMLAGGSGGGGWMLNVQPAPGWDSRIMNTIVQGLIFTIQREGESNPQQFLSGGRSN